MSALIFYSYANNTLDSIRANNFSEEAPVEETTAN